MLRKSGYSIILSSILFASFAHLGCGAPRSSRVADLSLSFDAETRAALNALVQEGISFSKETGASYSIRGPNGELWQEVGGMANLQRRESMRPTSRFLVGSNTKIVVAVVVLQLVEEGRLSLDDTLGDLLPEWPRWKDVTVRQLLGMQSGIPDYLRMSALHVATALSPGQRFSPQRLLGFVAREPVDFAPGERCIYSNSNYILLGMIVEKIAGAPMERVIADRVVMPLGLRDTYLRTEPGGDEHLVNGYMQFGLASTALGISSLFYRILPGSRKLGDQLVDLTDYFHPTFTWAAGALVSTSNDMAEILKSLFEGRLLRPETLKAMMQTRSCTIVAWPYDYGLGIYRKGTPFGDAWGHGGITYGYRTESVYVPSMRVSLSRMHNVFPEQNAVIEDEMLAILKGVGSPPATEPCKPPFGFPDTEANHRLNFSFRGVLNASGSEPRPGMGWIRAREGNQFRLYSGEGVFAVRANDGALEIESHSPPLPGSQKPRKAVLRFPRGASGGMQALLYAIERDRPRTGQRKECIEAVSDGMRPLQLSTCRLPPDRVGPGELFRVFGSVGTTRNSGETERRLRDFGLERCRCFDESGARVSCP